MSEPSTEDLDEREAPEPPAEERAEERTEEASDAEPPPKKRRKKRKKSTLEPEVVYDLPFARAWPEDPELRPLVEAFSRGNYAYVRQNAAGVAERASDPKVKAAARDLRRRIDPDPVAGVLLLVAIGLLVMLAAHYLGHRQESQPVQKPSRPAPHPTSS